MKQVVYFYEGETEKKLLEFLKNTRTIKSGKLKKFNLWTKSCKKLIKTIRKGDIVIFVIDTDTMEAIDTFKKNIRLLKSYNICLIVQHKNLEDELCFSCNKKDTITLFTDFYDTSSAEEFKTKFIKESNLEQKLTNNAFDFKKLWSRADDFQEFSDQHHLLINLNCNTKP